MHAPLACIKARGMAQPERVLCAAARLLLRASVVHHKLTDLMACRAPHDKCIAACNETEGCAPSRARGDS